MTVLPMKELGTLNSPASECHFAVLIPSLQMQNKSSSCLNPNFNFLNTENNVTSEANCSAEERLELFPASWFQMLKLLKKKKITKYHFKVHK